MVDFARLPRSGGVSGKKEKETAGERVSCLKVGAGVKAHMQSRSWALRFSSGRR